MDKEIEQLEKAMKATGLKSAEKELTDMAIEDSGKYTNNIDNAIELLFLSGAKEVYLKEINDGCLVSTGKPEPPYTVYTKNLKGK
jgi:hypothetical protein